MIGGALLCLAVIAGVAPRLSQRRQATIDTKELAVPNVTVVSPSTGAPADGLMLPAEVKPWQEASIFSRVNGYLKSWDVDIGAHVELEDGAVRAYETFALHPGDLEWPAEEVATLARLLGRYNQQMNAALGKE